MKAGKKKNGRPCVSDALSNAVDSFFQRDDVSRMTAGKKDTVTKNKIKRQKRYLNDTLANLHKQFLSENPTVSVSYSTFCRLRPFHVLIPHVTNRETCLCKTCDNAQLILYRLKIEGVVSTTSPRTLLKQSCCEIPEQEGGELDLKMECCYGKCKDCGSKMFEGNFDTVNLNKIVKYSQWETVTKTYMKGETEKEVKAVEKMEKTGTIQSLVDEIMTTMKVKLGPHIYNIAHQYLETRHVKQKLQNNEALIHIDFAENWATKLSAEVMSKHFGASQVQVTLHNGVAYFADRERDFSFSTISDSPRHDGCAVWTYLNPVLLEIKAIGCL